jgi:hypothetical protein
MPRLGRLNPIRLSLAALGALLVACAVVGGGPEEVLGLAPLILLLLALFFDRCLGEELIGYLAMRLSRWRATPAATSSPAPLSGSAVRRMRLLLLAAVRPLRAPPSPGSVAFSP